MNWFEKIKSMDYSELALFLAEFNSQEIVEDYCRYACPERQETVCNHEDCIVEDSAILEKWLHLFAK